MSRNPSVAPGRRGLPSQSKLLMNPMRPKEDKEKGKLGIRGFLFSRLRLHPGAPSCSQSLSPSPLLSPASPPWGTLLPCSPFQEELHGQREWLLLSTPYPRPAITGQAGSSAWVNITLMCKQALICISLSRPGRILVENFHLPNTLLSIIHPNPASLTLVGVCGR